MIKKAIKKGCLQFFNKGKEIPVDNQLLTSINYFEPSNLININVLEVNVVVMYGYDNLLDAPFILEVYLEEVESNFEFSKGLISTKV